MALSAENTLSLQQLQAKVLAGQYTKEELRAGIAILRQDRVGAQIASTASRTATAAAKKTVDPTAVLANLKMLGAKLSSGPVA